MLEAAGRLQGFGLSTPWRLAIAGEGEDREVLEGLLRERGLAPRVHLLGQREDIPDLQAAADLFALSSWSEGLPLSVLEAMSAGHPIVSTEVGGIPEAVTHGEHGLLTPPGDPGALADALRVLISDRALRERFGRAARHRAETEFAVGVMTNAYERLYRGEPTAAAGRPEPAAGVSSIQRSMKVV
jgi:glycosyltransferase involved in cell wall biosynthesis